MVTLEEVKGLKVPELKEELKARGLDIKGVKADLVKRLEDALAGTGKGSVVDTVAATTDAPLATATQANGKTPIEFKPQAAAAEATLADEPPKAEAAEAPATGGPASGASEVDKRKQRAERFGIPVANDTDKLKSRAERFGLPAGATNGATNGAAGDAKRNAGSAPKVLSGEELEKQRARAKRFNLPLPTSADEEAAKKKARLERFGTATGAAQKTGTTEELKGKLAARAQRFGLETKPAAEAGKAKPAAASKPALTPEEEAKRQARAIRFAAS